MSNIIEQGITNFDWAAHEADCSSKRREGNKIIKAIYPDSNVLCQEDYALELYELMQNYPVIKKDISSGDILPVTEIKYVKESIIHATLSSGVLLEIDLDKERKFCNLYGINTDMIPELFADYEYCENLLDHGIYAHVTTKNNSMKGSLIHGHIEKMKVEFVSEIKEPKSAYSAKIIEKNKGGFMVEVSGVPAFLPGGLAAANKIIDFDDYIGTNVTVMIEDYFANADTFIVSHKKYIKHMMPSMISDLDTQEMYTGIVTGTAKYGVFLEFGESDNGIMLTGLLHSSKMTSETKQMFEDRKFRPGVEVKFWIKEITPDNRLILTDVDPMKKLNAVQEFKEENLGLVKSGKVVSVKHFGTLVKLDKDVIGLIPKNELSRKKKTFVVGDSVNVTVDEVTKDKIYLSLLNEA